jgi:hypothetical protein
MLIRRLVPYQVINRKSAIANQQSKIYKISVNQQEQ